MDEEKRLRYTFDLNNVEIAAYETWLEAHKKVCPMYLLLESFRAPGEHWDREALSKVTEGRSPTWTFAHTGIGTAIDFTCECGETVEVTDFDCW